MAIRRSLYLIFALLVWLFTSPGIFAQEPELSATPQRVSGGVIEQDTLQVDTVVRPIRLQSPIFRDTMTLSKMSWISVGVPGFSQLYNNQYWKIPVLYGTVGALTYLTINANKSFQQNKRQYDYLMVQYYDLSGTTATQFYNQQIRPIESRMNKYNTQRSLYFAGASLTYLYFLADGVLNYPHPVSSVKRATTLAFLFPGAGQFYNRSYWKIPIVIGAFATMGYLIDWNNRGYQRYRTAYNLGGGEFADSRFSLTDIQNARKSFRRNRDLCIILTGAAYLLSVVEAHVDAHLKDFDVTDDLALRVEPTMLDMSGFLSERNSGYPGFGLSMKLNF